MQLDKAPVIREARRTDASVLAKLSGELGYPATTVEIENRFDKIFSYADHCIYVAEIDSVVGWIHVAVIQTLESNAYVEICGLVITETFRGLGIGSQLVAKGEHWAKEKGLSRIRVRTNIIREETRIFYKKMGYGPCKTQEVFDKIINVGGLTSALR